MNYTENRGDAIGLLHRNGKIEIVFFEESGKDTLNVDVYHPHTTADLAEMLNYFCHGGDEQPCLEDVLSLKKCDDGYKYYTEKADYVFISDDSDYSDTITYMKQLLKS